MIVMYALGAAVACLLAARRCDSAARMLAVQVLADCLRMATAPGRLGAAKPYQGAALASWIACELAPALLPPAVALSLATRCPGWLGAWVGAVAALGFQYPTLRGQALLGVIAAWYVAGYGIGVARAVEVSGWRPLTRDESALLALLATGIAAVFLVATAGPSEWWAVTIPYAAGLAGATVAGLWPSPPDAPAPPGRQASV